MTLLLKNDEMLCSTVLQCVTCGRLLHNLHLTVDLLQKSVHCYCESFESLPEFSFTNFGVFHSAVHLIGSQVFFLNKKVILERFVAIQL